MRIFGHIFSTTNTPIYIHKETTLYSEVNVVLVFHEKVRKTTVSIPDYLHAYAKERRISLSGTLTELLRKDYERTRLQATNQPLAHSERPTQPGGTADD